MPAGVAGIFALAWVLPSVSSINELNFCAVKSFLGIPCPGCGLTRSISALVHGQLRASIDAHPLGPIVAIWLIYFASRELYSAIAGRRLPDLMTQTGRDLCVGAFVLALFLQWALHLAIIYLD